MKRIAVILIFVLMLLPVVRSFAQQSRRDKVEALRVAFIGKRLDLSQQESARFWPVYDEYNDKVRAVRRQLRLNYQQTDGSAQAAESAIQNEQRLRQAETDLHRLYAEKLRAVIGPAKFVRLRLAEEDFKREMIRAID